MREQFNGDAISDSTKLTTKGVTEVSESHKLRVLYAIDKITR